VEAYEIQPPPRTRFYALPKGDSALTRVPPVTAGLALDPIVWQFDRASQ